MNRRLLVFALMTLLFLGLTTMAYGQATRTWVSGVGDDANPCSRTAPCKTFAGAISKTAAGGEISVLDPGGFGAVNITKSITLNGAGTLASILFSGTNGVIVNGSGIIVNLVDISLNGGTPTSPGVNGVRIIAAASVSIDGCDIFNFSAAGVADERTVAGSLQIRRTRIHNSIPFGGVLSRFGIKIQPSAGVVNNDLLVDNVAVFGHPNNSSTGIFVSGGGLASITRSTVQTCDRGIAADNATISINNTSVFRNGNGVRAVPNGIINLTECLITSNTVNGTQFAGGTINSFGNNRIIGNTGNNGAGVTPVAEQ
jgi:hypothetical protein